MKHYGLKRKGINGWLRDQSGMIFWTTSKAVANEQLKIISQPSEYEVCEFIDDQKSVAAGVGGSYESLSRDYSQSKYSISRLALLTEQGIYDY